MITQCELKEILDYDPLTGLFTWLVSAGCRSKGSQAGCTHMSTCGKTYVEISTCGKTYPAHRLAHLYMEGRFPKEGMDHEDGDGTNNIWTNLREADHVENGRNQRLPSSSTSQFIGVTWRERSLKWEAHIRILGVYVYLGLHTRKKDAVQAREDANVLYGFHRNHGQVRPL